MEIFKVHKDIRANGRHWHELIRNLFDRKQVRDAWTKMENYFSQETVDGMISAINRFTDDPEESIIFSTGKDGSVIARYMPKGSAGLKTPPAGIPVTYTLNGVLDNPVEIEYNEESTVS